MLAVIRLRGKVGVRKEIEDTLKMLGLKAANHCVVVPESPSYEGMIKKVCDFVAYGKLDFDTFLAMVRKRARLVGEKRLTEENVKELGFGSTDSLARAIFEQKVRLRDIPGLKPVFRLTPPAKGHKSLKEHYPKGSLGCWGEKINELLKRMI